MLLLIPASLIHVAGVRSGNVWLLAPLNALLIVLVALGCTVLYIKLTELMDGDLGFHLFLLGLVGVVLASLELLATWSYYLEVIEKQSAAVAEEIKVRVEKVWMANEEEEEKKQRSMERKRALKADQERKRQKQPREKEDQRRNGPKGRK